MYKKLFTKSNLSSKEINKRLDIVNIQRERLEVANKINIELFVKYGKQLSVSESDVAELIVSEIREMYKKNL